MRKPSGLIIYLDTSVLVPLLIDDAFTQRARQFLITQRRILVISDIAAAEFVAVITRRLRTGLLTEADARAALFTLDAWSSDAAQRIECRPADIAMAIAFMRRLDLPLRTMDAIHIAVARRVDAELATFDVQMQTNSRALGVAVAAV